MVTAGLKHFDADTLEWLKLAAPDPQHSRTYLARELCKRSNWYNQAGSPCVEQARSKLEKLCKQLGITLPEVSTPESFLKKKPQKIEEVEPPKEIQCSLEELGKITLKKTTKGKKYGSGKWNKMLIKHHPLESHHTQGKAIKYWIKSQQYGVLGGISFVAGSWQVNSRDKYIGWTDRARVEAGKLDMIANNHRFLIMNHIKVHGLASHVLEMSEEAITQDWEKEYGLPLVLCYSYVGKGYDGTSYKKAGWEKIGVTTGKRDKKNKEPKKVFAKALTEEFQEILCAREYKNPFLIPGDIDPSKVYILDEVSSEEWEYSFTRCPDKRNTERIKEMGRRWAKRPGVSIAQKFPEAKERANAVRLISNYRVDVEDVLESHKIATAMRCNAESVVLAVQDTTALNLDSCKKSTKGTTDIGGQAEGTLIHANMAFTEDGKILGCLDLDGTFRQECKEESQNGEKKSESFRWLKGIQTAHQLAEACEKDSKKRHKTRVVSVSDREGDFWDIYDYQNKNQDGVGVLTRACASKRRKIVKSDGSNENLFDFMRDQKCHEGYTIHLPAHGGNKPRKQAEAVEISLRFSKVELKSPERLKEETTIPIIAVLASATTKLSDGENEWLLLCSEGEATLENAERIVKWYGRRWGIEEMFRTLKTCAKIGDYKFDNIKDILKCVAFDVVTTCKIISMLHTARNNPEACWSTIMTKEDLIGLRVLLKDLNLERYAGKEFLDYVDGKLIPDIVTGTKEITCGSEENLAQHFSADQEAHSDKPEDEASPPNEESLLKEESQSDQDSSPTEEPQPEDEESSPLKMTAQEVVILMGRVGGFLPRKSQPLPGYLIMWRAYFDLRVARGSAIASLELARSPPSRPP